MQSTWRVTYDNFKKIKYDINQEKLEKEVELF